MSELASAAVGQATLLAKGATEDQALAFLQPVVISTPCTEQSLAELLGVPV